MLIIHSTKHKRAVATDLNWQVLDPFGNSLLGHKQLIEYIKTGGYIGITYKNGKDINLGVGRDIHSETEKDLKIISIAHQIAMNSQMRERSLLVFLKNTASGDESIFAIGLINGNVVIDQLIEGSDLVQIVRDFSKINIFTTSQVEIFGDISPKDMPVNKIITLDDVLRESTHNKKYVETLKNSLIVFYLVIGLIVFLLAYFFYGIWQESILSSETALSSKLKVINSPENVYAQRINLFLKTPLTLAKTNISLILEEIGSFPFVMANWRVQSIRCENYTCFVNWTSIGGTYQEFINAALPNWSNIALETHNGSLLGDMKSLKSSFTVSAKKELLPEFKDLPKFENFTFAMGDLLRSLNKKGWESALNAPSQIETPTEGVDLSIKNHPLALLSIPWSANDQGWRETEEALHAFGDLCTLDSLKLELHSQTPVLSTHGKCYVKK